MTLAQVLPQLDSARLASVEIVRPDLEAVYLALTGRRYREEDSEAPEKAPSDVGSDDVSAR